MERNALAASLRQLADLEEQIARLTSDRNRLDQTISELKARAQEMQRAMGIQLPDPSDQTVPVAESETPPTTNSDPDIVSVFQNISSGGRRYGSVADNLSLPVKSDQFRRVSASEFNRLVAPLRGLPKSEALREMVVPLTSGLQNLLQTRPDTPWTLSQIHENFPDHRKTTLSSTLSVLVSSGRAMKVGRGIWKSLPIGVERLVIDRSADFIEWLISDARTEEHPMGDELDAARHIVLEVLEEVATVQSERSNAYSSIRQQANESPEIASSLDLLVSLWARTKRVRHIQVRCISEVDDAWNILADVGPRTGFAVQSYDGSIHSVLSVEGGRVGMMLGKRVDAYTVEVHRLPTDIR